MNENVFIDMNLLRTEKLPRHKYILASKERGCLKAEIYYDKNRKWVACIYLLVDGVWVSTNIKRRMMFIFCKIMYLTVLEEMLNNFEKNYNIYSNYEIISGAEPYKDIFRRGGTKVTKDIDIVKDNFTIYRLTTENFQIVYSTFKGDIDKDDSIVIKNSSGEHICTIEEPIEGWGNAIELENIVEELYNLGVRNIKVFDILKMPR